MITETAIERRDRLARDYDILDQFGRVFWKAMPLATAVQSARDIEPYWGAYRVVPTTSAPHGSKPRT